MIRGGSLLLILNSLLYVAISSMFIQGYTFVPVLLIVLSLFSKSVISFIGEQLMLLIAGMYWLERNLYWDAYYGFGHDDQFYFEGISKVVSNGFLGAHQGISFFSKLLSPLGVLLTPIGMHKMETYLCLNLLIYIFSLRIIVGWMKRNGITNSRILLFTIIFSTFQPVVVGYTHLYRDSLILLGLSFTFLPLKFYIKSAMSVLAVFPIRGFSLIYLPFLYKLSPRGILKISLIGIIFIYFIGPKSLVSFISDSSKSDKYQHNIELVGLKGMYDLRMERRSELYETKTLSGISWLQPLEVSFQAILNPITVLTDDARSISPNKLQVRLGKMPFSFFMRNIIVVLKYILYIQLFGILAKNWRNITLEILLFIFLAYVSGQTRHFIPFILVLARIFKKVSDREGSYICTA